MSNSRPKKAPVTFSTILLIFLLALRVYLHISYGYTYFFVVESILFLLALIGVITRKIYGGVLTMGIALLDIVYLLITLGFHPFITPLVIYDVILILLGSQDMGKIEQAEGNVYFRFAKDYGNTPTAKIVTAGNPVVISSQNTKVLGSSSTYCSKCGKKLNLNDTFCENCGERLT